MSFYKKQCDKNYAIVKGVVSNEKLYNGYCNRWIDDSVRNWLFAPRPKNYRSLKKKGNKIMQKSKRMARKAENIVEDAVDDLLEL